MSKIAFFGGTGGLGKKLTPYLEARNYEVEQISSKQVDLSRDNDIENYFYRNPMTENVVIFNAYSYDKMLQSYKRKDVFSEIDKQVSINIAGITKLISTALFYMNKEGIPGRIIVASSVTVKNPIIGTSVYAASKGYLETLVKTAAKENGYGGITLNAVRLGYMNGGLIDTVQPDVLEKLLNTIPVGKLGDMDSIANTIHYLITTPYITGTTIELTGGL